MVPKSTAASRIFNGDNTLCELAAIIPVVLALICFRPFGITGT